MISNTHTKANHWGLTFRYVKKDKSIRSPIAKCSKPIDIINNNKLADKTNSSN